MIRAFLLAAALLITHPAAAQSAKNFKQAATRAEAQRAKHADSTSSYADTWTAFNNQHHLDERDGCYFLAEGALTQVLEIDETGKVVGYFSDKDDGRSECWARTYLGVVFPKPPFAPYWHEMTMR